MPCIQYVEKRFNAESKKVLDKAVEIIADYQAQGLILTLRQLYYRFVAAALIPNTEKSYKRLGSIVNDGRLAGILDWEAIEDRSRNIVSLAHWDSASEIVDACASQFRTDKWVGQDYRCEVWVEKQALESVVADACKPLDVTCFACKGYVSQSEAWRAAMRLREYRRAGQTPVIIHLGDHDPSGIDMSRDIEARFQMFRVPVEFRRIALNMDQVTKYAPPPNPAKMTDSRATGYVDKYGSESWELDALEPKVLRALIQDAIKTHLDADKFEAQAKEEKRQKEVLSAISSGWDQVSDFVKGL